MGKMSNICFQKIKMLSVVFFIFLFCIVWYGFNNTVFAADYYSGDYSCTIVVYNDTYGGSDHYTTTWHLYSDNEICGYYDDGGISKIYSLSGYSGNYIAIDNDTGAEFRTGTYSGNNSTFSKIYPHDLSVTCKFFQTYDGMMEYFETGDDSGQINKPQIDITDKDKQDSAYSLTGFTADKTINASWTGTTQRSNMLDVDVDEFVRCVVGYGYKEAPGQIATTKQLDADYPTADLGCTVLWDDIQPDDDSIFVRYVAFYPYYSGSDGIFGAYYYGNPSYVYFKADGSIEKQVTSGSSYSSNELDFVNFSYQEVDGVPHKHKVTWSPLDTYDNNTFVYVWADIAWKRIATERQDVYKYPLVSDNSIAASSGIWQVDVTYPWKTYFEKNNIDYSVFSTQWTDKLYFQVVKYDSLSNTYLRSNIRYIDLKLQTTGTIDYQVDTGITTVDPDTGEWVNQSPDGFINSSTGTITNQNNKDIFDDLGLSNDSSIDAYFDNLGKVFINGARSLITCIGEFPSLVNNVFLFLPSELISLIILGIVIAILLRLVGR